MLKLYKIAAWFFTTIIYILAFYMRAGNAELRICNDTQERVGIALGYQNKNAWLTNGWWQIAPMSCSSLIKEKLQSRYYYIHAEDEKNEARWEGPIFLCVKDSKFNITGIRNCYIRGYQKAGFTEIDTKNNTSWTIHLTEKNKS